MRIIQQDLLIDGDFEGIQFGSGVSFILVDTDVIGYGTALHQHPYTETIVMRGGRARIVVGDEEIVAEAGQIIVVPPLTPHLFENLGPDRLQSTNIHASEKYITTWL